MLYRMGFLLTLKIFLPETLGHSGAKNLKICLLYVK